MRAIYLTLILFLAFGCINESISENLGGEALLNSTETDIDNDGIIDYSLFTYSPYNNSNLIIQRFISVSTITKSEYIELEENLTDVDLLFAHESLDEFSQSRMQDDSFCSKNIGILNVVCSDITTCSRLCSSTNKCRPISEDYSEPLAGSMISYVQDNSEIRSLILDSSRMIKELRGKDIKEKNELLQKTRDIISRIASINANPLYNNFELCTYSNFGAAYAVDVANKIGKYETSVSGYEYTVVLSLTPEKIEGNELLSTSITDSINYVEPDDIKSIQKIEIEKIVDTKITWNSAVPNKRGYIIIYEFHSELPPEQMLNNVKKPEIKVSSINMAFLAPTIFIFDFFNNITNDYYISLGYAIGATLSVLLLIYNIFILLFVLLSERTAGASFTTGFRVAFGRTVVTWKSDIVIALVFVALGFYISTYHAVQPSLVPPILESLDTLIKSNLGILGFGLSGLGVVLFYLAFENITKITILERAYGMVIKHEKDVYSLKAAALHEKIQELEKLITEYGKENFEFSREYDVLSSAKGLDVLKISSKITAQTKTMIDEHLASVEGAIASIKERKVTAENNWPKWSSSIAKMLDEQNQVYSTSLVSVPASLRAYALNRYVSENDGVILDNEGIKKKVVTAESMAHGLIAKSIVDGIIVIKQDKIEFAEFSDGSGTVKKALALKIRTYIMSLAKKIGQHDPQSFVNIGSTSVIAYMKGRAVESFIFVKREKFNDAIEMWKEKLKVIDQ